MALAIQFNQTISATKAKVQLGTVFAKKGEFSQSEQYLMEVINDEQKNGLEKYTGKAYHYLANNYMALEEYDTAIDLFNKPSSYNSSTTGKFISYLDRGDCYLRMGENEKALASLQKAVMLYQSVSPNPEYAEVFNLLAKAYLQKGNTQSMATSFTSYGDELKNFLQQKEEIIQLLNKLRFELFFYSRASLKDLWGLLFTYRNISLLAFAAVCLLISYLGYKYYRWIQLKKDIAKKLNSI